MPKITNRESKEISTIKPNIKRRSVARKHSALAKEEPKIFVPPQTPSLGRGTAKI